MKQWGPAWQAIWHYHRKALLPGEIAVPSAGGRGFASVIAGVLGLFPLLRALLRPGSVFFRLDRANLRSPGAAQLHEVVIPEKRNSRFGPNVVLAGYLVRLVLRMMATPVAAVESARLNRVLSGRGLAPVARQTAAAALGDRLFCRLLAVLKRRAGGRDAKILFCAAVVPDAHLYAAPGQFIEVAHGVIHFGHPSLFNLERTATEFIVPDARSKAICEENTQHGRFTVDSSYFKTFFTMDEAGAKVFVAQPGDPFEGIATRFLAAFPDWKVRPHPRSSPQFVEAHRARVEMSGSVTEVASVSSTMLNDATQLGIPMTVIRSSFAEENEKLETSFEGLLLPAQYEVSYV